MSERIEKLLPQRVVDIPEVVTEQAWRMCEKHAKECAFKVRADPKRSFEIIIGYLMAPMTQAIILSQELARVDHAKADLLEACKAALECNTPIARTGRVSQGGESLGNSIHVEQVVAILRAAIAKAEGGQS